MKSVIKIITIVALTAVLSGCVWSFKQPDPAPRVAKEIVTALPDASRIPNVKDNSNLPIHDLTEKDRGNYSKIVKKYALTVEILKKRNKNKYDFIVDYKAAILDIEKMIEEEAEKDKKNDQ